MIRSIAFLEPKPERLHIFSRYELPRLGGILLATLMRKAGYDCRAYFLSRREILARRLRADLVAISTITPTARGAYNLADHFRSRGFTVVLGGPHVTFLPEEGMEHADYCIRGEGELSFPRLVEALNQGGPLETVPGLAWRENGELRLNPIPGPLEDLDSLPFPDFSLLTHSRRHMGPPYGREMVPIQTSRGCPYACTFCSVTGMFGRRYRYRSTGNVLEELRRYDPRRHFLFFYDDHFTSNRARTKELLSRMVAERLNFDWVTQVRSDIARDPELLDLMREAGCRSLFIGFESVDEENLREMRKGQTPQEIAHAIREIQRRRIHVHGMFVLGFDADTPEKVRATVDFALRHRIDTTQFSILTPIPGSELFGELQQQGRILDYQWDTYDGHHVKFLPARFTVWELQKAQIYAHLRFFALNQVIARLFRGRFRAFFMGVYARSLNHRWLRWERDYLRRIRTSLRTFRQALKPDEGLAETPPR